MGARSNRWELQTKKNLKHYSSVIQNPPGVNNSLTEKSTVMNIIKLVIRVHACMVLLEIPYELMTLYCKNVSNRLVFWSDLLWLIQECTGIFSFIRLGDQGEIIANQQQHKTQSPDYLKCSNRHHQQNNPPPAGTTRHGVSHNFLVAGSLFVDGMGARNGKTIL